MIMPSVQSAVIIPAARREYLRFLSRVASCRAALPLAGVVVALLAMPGEAAAQGSRFHGLRFTLDPADGVVNIPDDINEECKGKPPLEPPLLSEECLGRAAYGTVRITPSFDLTIDYPSVRTVLKLLPTTPRGDQYAVFGTDYYLPGGQFVLLPDGTIAPPFIEVRGLNKLIDADKTARIRLYAISGDKKYNRARAGHVTELDITFKAPPAAAPRVELYLAPAGRSGRGVSRPNRGLVVERVQIGTTRPVVLKARLHNQYSGESIAADADIRLKLSALPPQLSHPAYARQPATYSFDVFQPMQDTLTIAAGESSATTATFVIVVPSGYADDVFEVLAPVIVDATDEPATTSMTTIGSKVSLFQPPAVVADAGLSASSVVEVQANTNQDGGVVGALVLAEIPATITVGDPRNLLSVTLQSTSQTGKTSADGTDFLQRMPGGNFVPFPGTELNYEYRVPAGASGVNRAVNLPLWLRQDGLVEGEEIFQVTLHSTAISADRTVTITDAIQSGMTIQANGSVALDAFVTEPGGSTVNGRLVPSHSNVGIAVGSGNSITYANSDGSITLAFTDTVGAAGGGADGLLTEAELYATDDWTFSSAAQTLSTTGSLPANLQAEQFPDATLAMEVPVRVGFADTSSVAIPEGDYGRAALTLTIEPPLSFPSVAKIVAVGGSATAAGDYPDVRAGADNAQSVTLPAKRSTVVFTPTHVIDDQIVEPNESFRLKLQDPDRDSYIIKSGAGQKEIELTNDDTATFTVESDLLRRLRARERVELTGRLNTIVQVGTGDNAMLSATEQLRSEDTLTFSDRDGDGYLRGDELVSALLHVRVDFVTRRYDFSAITPHDTGLPEDAFLFPRAADLGRTHLPWHADILLTAARIAPRFDNLKTIRLKEGDLRGASSSVPAVASAAAANIRPVSVRLSQDVDEDATAIVSASHDPDGAGGRAVKRVSKELVFAAADDATTPLAITFTAADFAALGIIHDRRIDKTKLVTTSVALARDTLRTTSEGVLVFSDASVPGPDIVVEDADSGHALMSVFLVDADDRPLDRLEVGRRTDAYVRVDIRDAGDLSKLLTVSELLAVDIALGSPLSGAGLTLNDLGNPAIPRRIVIPVGANHGRSEEALRITPVKSGTFNFIVRALTPSRLGHLTANTVNSLYLRVPHRAVEGDAAARRLVTLTTLAVDVAEGATGLSAAVSVIDAGSELPAPVVRGGAEEAVTLHYAFASSPSGGDALNGAASDDLAGAAPFVAGSVEIAAGASAATINVPDIIDDDEEEGNEHFTLTLTSLVDAEGLPLIAGGRAVAVIGLADSVARYTITANDGGEPPTASGSPLLATAQVMLKEVPGAGETDAVRTGTITLTRPTGVDGIIRGRVIGADVSTEAALDYRVVDDTFEIAAAATFVEVRVAALADGLTERNETFEANIVITEPTTGLLPPATAPVVTILDGDRPVTLQLASTALSGVENELIEVEVQLSKNGAEVPLREHPVYFTVTPSFSGSATAEDFLVSLLENGEQTTRAATNVAELTAGGVLNPDETTSAVRFLVAADGLAEGEETLSFTLSLSNFDDADANARNTHDGGIVLGSSLEATVTIAASLAASALDVLVITPTTLTRIYGEAPPSEYAFTVAPQAGSAFATGDEASTTFFTANPLGVSMLPANNLLINPNSAGRYQFRLAAAPAYATGIEAKYEFVLAPDILYTITPKEITFTGTAVDKVYDGHQYAPQTAFAGSFAANDIEALYRRGLTADTQTHDQVYVAGGVYEGKDVGAGQTITGFGLGGTQSANYTLASASSVAGAITASEISNLQFVIEDLFLGESVEPVIDIEQTGADGVVPAEMADFRAGLRVSAMYDSTPTETGVSHPVTVTVSGAGCTDDDGAAADCGLTDSGSFKASNYQLESGVTTVASAGRITSRAGKPTNVTTERDPDERGVRGIKVEWDAPANVGVPGGVIAKYYVRWRTAAASALTNLAPPTPAVAAGAWQSAAGNSAAGEDVGTATAYAIAGLVPGVGYQVQVRGENELGPTSASDWTDEVVALGKPLPPQFAGLTAVDGMPDLLVAALRQRANSGGGTATSVIRWRVRTPPGPWLPGEQGLKEIPSADDTTATVGGADDPLTSGVEYEVQVASRTAYGLSDWSESLFGTPGRAAATAPATMANVNLVYGATHGGLNIAVSWLPPDDGGAPITEYNIRWKLSSATRYDAGDIATVAAGGVNAYVVRNLTSGSQYQVQVRARNRVGDGEYGLARHGGDGSSHFSVGGGPSVTTVIVPVFDTLVPDDGQLTINWRPPLYVDGSVNDYGTTFLSYRIRWRERRENAGELIKPWINQLGFAGQPIDVGDMASAAQRSYVIPGLANGTAYRVELWLETAYSLNSQSALRAYLAGFTQFTPLDPAGVATRVVVNGVPSVAPPPPPDAPSLNALALGDRFLTLVASWTAPQATITAYQLQWRPYIAGGRNQKNWQMSADIAASATSYTITEYTRDDPGETALREIEYEARVRAVNAAGNSEWSASQRIQIRGTGPGAPSAVRVETGHRTATVFWAAPSDSGGDASYRYNVRWRIAEVAARGATRGTALGPWTPSAAGILVDAGATRYDIASGLVNDTLYEVQVRARNNAGPSWFSPSVSFVPGPFTLDVDADGAVGGSDGILVARYLLGLRGAALTADLTTTLSTNSIQQRIRRGITGEKVFDVNGDGTVEALDGLLIARYLLGARDAALTAGLTGTAPDVVMDKIAPLAATP